MANIESQQDAKGRFWFFSAGMYDLRHDGRLTAWVQQDGARCWVLRNRDGLQATFSTKLAAFNAA